MLCSMSIKYFEFMIKMQFVIISVWIQKPNDLRSDNKRFSLCKDFDEFINILWSYASIPLKEQENFGQTKYFLMSCGSKNAFGKIIRPSRYKQADTLWEFSDL